MTDKIKIRYWQHRNSEANDGLAAAWLRNDRCESAQDDGIPSDVRAAIALLIAPELGEAHEKLRQCETANVSFTEQVVKYHNDAVAAKIELATLRARVAKLEAGIRDITDDIDEDLAEPDARPLIYCEFAKDAVLGDLRRLRALLAKSNPDKERDYADE